MKEKERLEVFSRWIETYQPIVYKVARSYGRNADEVKDLTQEIAYQIWQSVSSFEGRSAESTWIYRVALNTAFNWRNKSKKHEIGHEDLAEHFHLRSEESPYADELEWLYGQIGKLNELDKSICLLMLEGYAYQEIAGITGISESNVGVKIHRIKKQLIEASKKLESHGF